jgi:hypothetical protein
MSRDDDLVAVPAPPTKRPRQVDILLILINIIIYIVLDGLVEDIYYRLVGPWIGFKYSYYINLYVFKYSYFLLLLGRGLCCFVTE